MEISQQHRSARMPAYIESRASLSWTAEGGCPHMGLRYQQQFPRDPARFHVAVRLRRLC